MVSPVSIPAKAVVKPAVEARVVYVSSSEGNDRNDGLSPAAPVRTVCRAESLVRDQSCDWALFKRGDVWNEGLESWHKRGRSPEQPLVIGAYGTGSSPVLKAVSSFADALESDHVSVIGVRFRADPARRHVAAPAASAAPRGPTVPAGPASFAALGHLGLGPAGRSDRTRSAFQKPPALAPAPAPARTPLEAHFLRIERQPAPASEAPRALSPASAAGTLQAGSAARPRFPGAVEPLAPLARRLDERHESLVVKRVRLSADDDAIAVTFSADVSAGLRPGDLVLCASDGRTIEPATMALEWDARRTAATWTFPGQPGRVLPPGKWRVVLRGYITDAQGRQLDGAGDGIGGEDYASPARLVSRGVPLPHRFPPRTHIETYSRRAA